MLIPSETEKHLGETWDPKDGLIKINEANKVILSFISSMSENQVPNVGIQEIINATDVLGLYAGYPSEAASMEGYIKTDVVLSYREVASILEGFSDNMNSLIKQRLNS